MMVRRKVKDSWIFVADKVANHQSRHLRGQFRTTLTFLSHQYQQHFLLTTTHCSAQTIALDMASTQALGAAALDRKARLAQLKSLKRKQPDTPTDTVTDDDSAAPAQDTTTAEENVDTTSKYLSGRNYDPETRGAKLGFETAPSEGKTTLELQAEALATETKRLADEEAARDAPLDLFKLQPKKPNWDLKRDLDRKLDVLNVRTDNAIARLVRERIGAQQAAARAKLSANGHGSNGGGDSEEAIGIEGTTLVEAVNVREREEEEELRREREEEEALLDGS